MLLTKCVLCGDEAIYVDVWWLWLIVFLAAFAAQCMFVAYADGMCLRAIDKFAADHESGGASNSRVSLAPNTPGGPVGVTNARVVSPGVQVTLQHDCPACQAPLQFQRTGVTTQVQCYQCQAVVEFETA